MVRDGAPDEPDSSGGRAQQILTWIAVLLMSILCSFLVIERVMCCVRQADARARQKSLNALKKRQSVARQEIKGEAGPLQPTTGLERNQKRISQTMRRRRVAHAM
jgi:hypothetical protein